MSGIPHISKNTAKGAFVDTSCITPLPTSQLLNDYGIRHDPHCVENISRNPYNDAEYWHKFTICNESYSCSEYPKNYILKVITDFVYPCELLPVYVSQKATKTFFLARNCLGAIIKLCEAGLCVPNPDRPDSPFKVVIIKDVLTTSHIPLVTVEPNILEVLKKRFSSGLLDLSRFYEDKDLHEFCPLSQPKLLYYVLSISEQLETQKDKISALILSYNNIKHLPDLQSLSQRSFNSIDLSYNNIQNIEDIVPLKDLPHVTWVRLEGNPLSCRFDSAITYFLYVKTICKNLKTLDNKRLFEDGFYKKHRTFLCDSKGFDFANQFLEQYFTYYDELNRPNIGSYYSENCCFSLTYRASTHYNTSLDQRLIREYRMRNRNILDKPASALNQVLFFCDKDKVLEQLYSLPVTIHNPHSFYVDLMAYSKTHAVIHVTGIFKSYSSFYSNSKTANPTRFGFSRNFVLKSEDGKEWIITNDQLHVYPPLSHGTPAWPSPTVLKFPEANFNTNNMDALVLTFESITGMTNEHSRSFLEKNNWNLELALHVFIDEHINNEIPEEAFNNCKEEDIKDESDDDDVIVTDANILPPIETLLLEKPKPPTINIWSKVNNEKTFSTENQNKGQNHTQDPNLPHQELSKEEAKILKRRMKRRKRYSGIPRTFQDQWNTQC